MTSKVKTKGDDFHFVSHSKELDTDHTSPEVLPDPADSNIDMDPQGMTEPKLGAEMGRKTVSDKLAERHKVSKTDGMARTAERKAHVSGNRKIHDSVFQRNRVGR